MHALQWEIVRHSPFIAPRHLLRDRRGNVVAAITELPKVSILTYPGTGKWGTSHESVGAAKLAVKPSENPDPKPPHWEPPNETQQTADRVRDRPSGDNLEGED